MTLPFPKAFRRLTLTPISHQTCCFLWLQETFLLFQQGQPPSFLWKCFTYCQPSLSAAQPATLAFLFSNIIFFPEFLSNPKFSQGRTALSKIKKIQVWLPLSIFSKCPSTTILFHFQSWYCDIFSQSLFLYHPLTIHMYHSQTIPINLFLSQPIPTYPNPTQPDLSQPNQLT